ncbi:glycosyltransferase family 4 protein [Acinetobacter sp. CFCC 11171]|uniref:glycosyltransferase family 4 protein n=1 Tax=Acinetobacter sp. CFCC 11171 TaxID=1775558 RepID=UPI000DD09F7E|nr:glycosyltransferase family 4 protein [Acinetobacter sp. CFCC 11171]
MKIAHVQVVPQLSGAQQVSLDIMSSLDCKNHDLYMICAKLEDFSEDFINQFNEIGVTIIEVPNLKREIGKHDYYAFKDLYKIFKLYNFDIIHTNSTKPGIIARISARLAGCKKIVHTVHGIAFHSHILFFKRIIFYFAELFSLYFGHYNITVNDFYKKYYPIANTKTIYNGVDFSKFQVSDNSSSPNSGLNFAFFARLDDQKNPIEFINAIYLLKVEGVLDSNPDVRFTLAGNGELKSKCESMIKELQLESTINIVGWIYDKNKFLNSVDVICQPSKWEAFGLNFVEAAFFRIPAISTKVEGIPEVVLDGQTGLLYDGDAEGLKECIKKFIFNRELVIELGSKARKRALEKFSMQEMVKKYHQIYFEN